VSPVKPTLREKKRYICFNVSGNFPQKSVQFAILSRIKRWIGEKDFALARVQFMSPLYDEKNSIGVIACNHAQYLDVKMGIILTEEIDGLKIKVDVFYASGIIKKSKEAIKNHLAKEKIAINHNQNKNNVTNDIDV
jgi:RNase P/RNase MRP subunit POP5